MKSIRHRTPDPHLWKNPDTGNHYIFFYDQTGRRVQRTLKTKSESIAQVRFSEFLKEYVRGEISGDRITRKLLREATEWYAEKRTPSLKPKSLAKVRNWFRYLTELVKVEYVDQVGPREIEAVQEALQGNNQVIKGKRPAARRSINQFVSFCSQFFRACQTQGWIRDNPVTSEVGRLRVRDIDRKKKRAFSPNEINAILEGARKRKHAQLPLILKTYYLTGMRDDELRHLTIADVNLTAREIYIRAKTIRYVTRYGKTLNYQWSPKVGDERIIPIDDRLYQDLVAHLGRWRLNPWRFVFTSSRGKKLSKVYEDLMAVCREVGIKDIETVDLHSMRRSFISHSLNICGRNLTVVMAIVGHSDVKTTMEYISVNKEDLHREMKKMGGVQVREFPRVVDRRRKRKEPGV